MNRVLLADFGSTRIKLLLWDRCTGLVDREERPGAVPIRSDGGRFETSPEFYWRTLESAVGELFRRSAAHASGSEPDSLWFCTEMHGFLLADRHGSPLSPYIGWQDQRAARTACGGERSTLDLMRPAEQNFRALTGMRLRPGLPWLNLADMVRRGEVPETAERILTLPDWILMRGGCTAPKSDPTMAAGTGFYDLTRGTWSRELLDEASSARTNCIFTEIAPTGTMLGVIRIAGRTLKTYGGTGDMLTALHGAGFGSERRAAINLGTGSQTAYMGNDEPDAPFEMRPPAKIPSAAPLPIFRAARCLPCSRQCLTASPAKATEPPSSGTSGNLLRRKKSSRPCPLRISTCLKEPGATGRKGAGLKSAMNGSLRAQSSPASQKAGLNSMPTPCGSWAAAEEKKRSSAVE